jgi:hypothetical protein
LPEREKQEERNAEPFAVKSQFTITIFSVKLHDDNDNEISK